MINYLIRNGLLPKRMDTRAKSTYGTAVMFSVYAFGMFALPIFVIGIFTGQITDKDMPALINIFIGLFILGGVIGFIGYKEK